MLKNVLILCLASFLIFSNIQARETLENKKEMLIKELKNIQGWCSQEKATTLFDLVIEEKPEVCVEIGAFGGSSIFPTALALKHNQKGTIYAIDAWDNQVCLTNIRKDDVDHYEWWGKINLREIYEGFLKMLNQFELISYCKVLQMTSEQALSQVPMKIDLLHIDGDHSKIASFFDARQYGLKVKIGGLIIFDDVFWKDSRTGERTTLETVEYLRKFCDEIKSVDNGNCIFLRKIKEPT